ncbi:MAG TPA: hypothetical protein VMX17_09075 [Candidatus Glassbacteria bacterium]|nr:hypothetical protein [Candidatus Glassbacteria bacterium]
MGSNWGYGSYVSHYGCSSKYKQCSCSEDCKKECKEDCCEEKLDGCFCRRCKTFYPMAEPDDKNDGKILCWGCKT